MRIPKKAVLAAVFTVLAVDAAWAVSFVVRSQCTFSGAVEVFTRPSVDQDADKLAPSVEYVKTEDGLDLVKTPEGDFWAVHGDGILPLLLAEQEHNIYEPPGHEVRPGDIVLDCGANVGVFTRKALTRGAGLVVAIEPAPATVQALKRTFDAEIRAGRVIVYPKGVWDHDDVLELKIDRKNQARNSVVIEGGFEDKVRVPLTTIDKMVSELNLPRVDFIKMDIEGAEKPALTGARETIRRFRPRMSISSEHLPDDFSAIPAVVKQIDSRYRYHDCDCQFKRTHLRSLVLAFDPI